MAATDIFETVKKVFVDEFEIDGSLITRDSLIFEELGLDSLDSVDLIVALEKAFNFKIDRANDGPVIGRIRSIGDILKYIESKRA
jgi:acyl carrier protein